MGSWAWPLVLDQLTSTRYATSAWPIAPSLGTPTANAQLVAQALAQSLADIALPWSQQGFGWAVSGGVSAAGMIMLIALMDMPVMSQSAWAALTTNGLKARVTAARKASACLSMASL